MKRTYAGGEGSHLSGISVDLCGITRPRFNGFNWNLGACHVSASFDEIEDGVTGTKSDVVYLENVPDQRFHHCRRPERVSVRGDRGACS